MKIFNESFNQDLNETDELWRFMKAERVIELLKDRSLAMANPLKMHDMGDSDEGRITKTLFDSVEDDENQILEGYLNSLYNSYISCWTFERALESEYESMWTTFGCSHTGVAIKSTVHLVGLELDKFVVDEDDDYRAPSYGEVIYDKNSQHKYTDLECRDPLFPLFFLAGRRSEFDLSHEKEVRFNLIGYDSSPPQDAKVEDLIMGNMGISEKNYKSLLHVPIQPGSMILELVLGKNISVRDEKQILKLAKELEIRRISKVISDHRSRELLCT